jgi:hypothetical protein
MIQPNYDQPSKAQYLALLNDEALLVQIEELHKKNSFPQEARYVRGMKKHVTIKRVCMKAALVLKERGFFKTA